MYSFAFPIQQNFLLNMYMSKIESMDALALSASPVTQETLSRDFLIWHLSRTVKTVCPLKKMRLELKACVAVVQSNPFGAAKPVNAEARLKELEEKIAKEKVCCLEKPFILFSSSAKQLCFSQTSTQRGCFSVKWFMQVKQEIGGSGFPSLNETALQDSRLVDPQIESQLQCVRLLHPAKVPWMDCKLTI